MNLSTVLGHAQSTAAFPYNIAVSTVEGNCYDDCRIIINIIDNAGNVIQINPQTHNAQNLLAYPLYDIQYHYRNVSANMNTQYDTVNDIQVNSGIYCIGVTAYVPDPNHINEFLLVDTTLCNINVVANYDHMEASVLSTWARNDYESWSGREFCGFRASFTCEDRGRIQLMLTKGKFPYHVIMLNDQLDTVRQRTFWQRAQSGTDSLYADFRDYYTFDSMATGNYRIIVYDSCEYSIVLSFSIPDLNPTNYRIYAQNNISCGDSNILHFSINRETYNLHDFDIPYIDSIIRYRFINPGADTTAWYYPQTSIWDLYWIYFNDTITQYDNYCPIYNDTIILEFEDLCTDLSHICRFFYSRNFSFYDRTYSINIDVNTVPDTCNVTATSGFVTQEYDFAGYPWWCGGCNYDITNAYSYPQEIPSRLYACPISYDTWSLVDSSLLAHNESDDFSWLSTPIMFTVDTVIPTHISITDARGCLLAERDDILTFDIQSPGITSYNLYCSSGVYDWCGQHDSRYVSINEDGVNALLFRQNMSIHLFDSPLYNYYNFEATCQNSEWSYTLEDSANHSTYIDFSMEEYGWHANLRDLDLLPPGRYSFEVQTSCGIDTIIYYWNTFFHDSIAFTAPTYFKTEQICDRLIVQPVSVPVTVFQYNIDPWTDNNEIMSNTYTPSYNMHVIEGVAGGYNEWPEPDGSFIFSLPGSYIIRTWAESSWPYCSHAERYDTIYFVPEYIDFNLGYAVICDYLSNIGNVLTHATNGSEPYSYYLYDQPDLGGSIIGTSSTGYFYEIPMNVDQQFSVLAVDSCYNSFYINLTATSLSQSVLAWEFGDNAGLGHCEGDSIHIAALPFTFDAGYQWTGPNGFSSDLRVNSIYLPYNSESGWYTVEILNTGCSTTIADSVYIQVIRAPRITLFSDPMVCPGSDATVGIAVEGNGTVDFTVYHSGAPSSGSESFTANANDTLFLQYPILSDNLFWADNISDNTCAYEYIIDSIAISIEHIFDAGLPSIYTTDGYACYGHTANLSIVSPISTPYYVFWYDNPLQEHLLKCDTITQANSPSFCQIERLTSDSTLYVSVANQDYCARLYGTFYHLVNMCNGNTLLQAGENVRFFDSGSEHHNYGDNEHFTHTFTCSNVEHINLIFNQVNISIGDTLQIYSGSIPNPDSLLANISNTSNTLNSLTVSSSSVTFVFNSNWVNNREGWDIEILTEIPMTAVYGFISPSNHDTIIDITCPSSISYHVEGVPEIDISQPLDYILDTVLHSDDGCESILHLHLIVNATSDTTIHNSLMPCQLPYTWNGVTFTDYGTQNAILTNAVGCDSTVTMILHWAPPIDSTTVFDTIVENQLPYLINGLTFNGPGTQIATLTNMNGCDSIVTMHLHVFYNVTAEADSIICDNMLPFVWNGATFTQSDTQTVVLTNMNGADSILTMRVIVFPTSHTTLRDTICQRTHYSNYGFNLSESETSTSGMNTFTRILDNVFDCDSVIDLVMLITPDITPNFYADPDRAMLSENPNIQFINTTDISAIEQMNYYWIWDFGDETQDTTTDYNTEHLYTQWDDYTVTLTLIVNGCESYYSIPVFIEADLRFPNVITPNGDGVNDVFIIKDMNPNRNNRLVIMDRWGKKVFDQNNYQTYMKDDIVYNADSGFGLGNLSEGVYFYTFYYEGAVRTLRFNGTITLLR